MSHAASIPVQIGQVKIGRAGQSLNAILGSCVGLGFLYRDKGVYGLAHCLLADSNGAKTSGGGRHVDQAIETLLKEMEVEQSAIRRLHVFVAGGANMTRPAGTDPCRLVGATNARFARKALKAKRLRIVHEDTGGDHGRRVTIDCTTGEFNVDHIPRLGAGDVS